MESRRRKKRNTRITFVHLLPLIFLGAIFVYFVARKGLGRFTPHFDSSQLTALIERGIGSIGTPHIVAIFIVMLIYVYLLPGNAWRLDNILFPKRESRRRRVPSLQGQNEAWRPKLTPESAAASLSSMAETSVDSASAQPVAEPFARGGAAAEPLLHRTENEAGVNAAKPERVG